MKKRSTPKPIVINPNFVSEEEVELRVTKKLEAQLMAYVASINRERVAA